MTEKISLSSGSIGPGLEKVAETTQLDERHVGRSISGGIDPPYNPTRLAGLMELNGTHAIAVKKKAKREVGFGFDIEPHERADDPSTGEGTEHETVHDFWHGRSQKWKIGPKGTPTTSPIEVFEQARQDYHGIGWLAIEVLYTADDRPAGLAHIPARTVRVKKSDKEGQTAGHGYVQELDGQQTFYAEAGDRMREDVDGNPDPVYLDSETGDVLEERPNNPANELLFIPNPHPNALYYGLPAWIAEIETMIGDHQARRFNREFFEWDTMGQYFVVVEGGTLTDDSRKDIREMIKGLREEEGRRVALLEAEELDDVGGFETDGSNTAPKIRIEQVQSHGDEDQAFTDYRARNEHDIAKVHEMPPQLIGVMESSNRSNIKEALRDFTKEVIEPAQERFAGRVYRIIHQTILGVNDWTINFHTQGAENEREQAEIASIITDSIAEGITVREARDLHGLDPRPEWMSDALAQTPLAELRSDAGPGDALEMALAESEREAAARARTETRIQNGALAD